MTTFPSGPVPAGAASSGLLLVADAAYPFDYGLLPPDVRIVLGYVGGIGMTPHIWTTDEVQAVRRTGRLWYPIYTVPMRALTAGDGYDAAAAMLPQLKLHEIAPAEPKFLDIEYSAYAADPAGALRCVTAWRSGLLEHGQGNGWPYLPLAAGQGWLAHWTGVRPTSLPPGVAGIQYANALAGDAYDLSVFDPRIFPHAGGTMKLDQEALDQIDGLLRAQLAGLFGRIHGDEAGTQAREVADLADAEQAAVSLSSISARLDTLLQGSPARLQLQDVTVPATVTIQASNPTTVTPAGS